MKQYPLTAVLLCLALLAGCSSRDVQKPDAAQPQPETPPAVTAPEEPQTPQATPTPAEPAPEEPKAPEQTPPAQQQPSTPAWPTTEPTEPQAPAATLPWWKSGLSAEKLVYPSDPNFPSCGDPESRSYLYEDDKKLSTRADQLFAPEGQSDPWDLSLLLRSATEVEDLGAPILQDNFYELVALDDCKYRFDFYEKGVLLTRSLPGEGQGEQVKLALDAENYALIQGRIPQILSGDFNYASWLTMLRRSRLDSAQMYNADGTASYDLKLRGNLQHYNWEVCFVRVSGAGKVSQARSLKDAPHLELVFNNGLRYSVYASDTELLVSTNDLDYSLIYSLQPDNTVRREWEKLAQGAENPPTGKPVIYLYPTETTDCQVKLDYDAFTFCEPAYDPAEGWRVCAQPDGTLRLADGSSLPYLYWEGDGWIDFDLSKGVCLPQEEIEGYLRETLPQLGLLPEEYNEMLDYWLPRMADYPYYQLTFAGADYVQAAALEVNPAPDSLIRVHLVFVGLWEPVELEAQQLPSPQRQGFTVVEWGGTDYRQLKAARASK